ncbi:UTP--glucose-1-phosphate uridylyltransferase [bacterium]|nr:UTP--glucose-1-phosphate uridylyltransferase [bacterium]
MLKKAVIPIAGLGTRFLPLSRVVPKELLPLVDKPVIHYIVKEAKASGIKEIVFVVRPKKKEILEYFKEDPKLEKLLKKRKREYLLSELYSIKELVKGISFSVVYQKEPLGDGHAILQAKKHIKKSDFGVFFADDVVDSDIPCLAQLENIFRTANSPVIGLKRVEKEKIPSYGIVKVEKISNRLYKVKDIVEKPEIEKAPSDLAIVGRYILTSEIFGYLERDSVKKKPEIILADALRRMLSDGKTIYGYEFQGRWLECGTKLSWLSSSFYLSLKDEKFKEALRGILKEL